VGDKLSKFKQPKHWIPVERLPRNDQGKINYEQVKNIAAVALASKPLSIADVNCPTVSSQSDI
jgi:acyl-coenzyme A synthetase/AMP-(fatty) acid ligase